MPGSGNATRSKPLWRFLKTRTRPDAFYMSRPYCAFEPSKLYERALQTMRLDGSFTSRKRPKHNALTFNALRKAVIHVAKDGLLARKRRQTGTQKAASRNAICRLLQSKRYSISLSSHSPRLVYALLGLVDFLEFLFRRTAYVLAKGGHAVGMMLQGELAVGAAHLVVGGRRRNA